MPVASMVLATNAMMLKWLSPCRASIIGRWCVRDRPGSG